MNKAIDIKELHQDTLNFNKGTAEGRAMLKKSLQRLKAGRSILIDKNNNIIAGNKTAEVAEKLGMKVRIIDSDGSKIVAVQRTDIELDSKEGRELAIADNATSAADISWNSDNLQQAQDMFDNFSMAEFGVNLEHNQPDIQNMGEVNFDEFEENQTLKIKLTQEQFDKVISKLHEYGDDLTEALLFYSGYYE